MLTGEFYSKGKFLLTGEYLVLYGAKALAVPLKFGQRMIVGKSPGPGIIQWETDVNGQMWFSAKFDLAHQEMSEYSDHKTAVFIKQILAAACRLQPGLQKEMQGYHIQNQIDFDINWGLGSSSSLISNMAWWLGVDAYDLYRELYKGSGYDVYCARAEGPILYRLIDGRPEIRETTYNPAFQDNLYFIYLGKKQDSQQSVLNFKAQFEADDQLIDEISGLTEKLLSAGSLDDFIRVIRRHEELMSAVLKRKKVKEEFFPDFPGEIKSLGAWGGDFILAASNLGYNEVKDYFSNKNLTVFFRWDKIVY